MKQQWSVLSQNHGLIILTLWFKDILHFVVLFQFCKLWECKEVSER